MNQLSLFTEFPKTYRVSEINGYIRDLMEGDKILQALWVQGEVSNFSQPKSGHVYFTIKDDKASLRCVMWKNQAARLTYMPQDGDQVEVHGSISVYEASGQYQLYADEIRPIGEGLLYAEFQRLKSKLESEGLFDTDRKRVIPTRPELIGLVTSPTGAALRDMLDTLRRRYPFVEVVLSPASVQGDSAPEEIVEAIKRLNENVDPDVILVARGGGSIEDLWAFNDEQVARAIAASRAPVISGVGHETDFTISDFAADLRAPTPTAAAELAVPDKRELHAELGDIWSVIVEAAQEIFRDSHWGLRELQSKLKRLSPNFRIRTDQQRLDELTRRILTSMGHLLDIKQAELKGAKDKIFALSPENVLQRGYAVVEGPDGELIKSIQSVDRGDEISVRVSDGVFVADVKSKK